MDTLCIPVSLGKTLRRKAIAQMNFLFSGADNVLVIDSSLQPVAENSVSRLQLRLQLACSPWMTDAGHSRRLGWDERGTYISALPSMNLDMITTVR